MMMQRIILVGFEEGGSLENSYMVKLLGLILCKINFLTKIQDLLREMYIDMRYFSYKKLVEA
jgi:hypothetical protein